MLLVIVIGETARASNFSLNGYPRVTNPLLSQRHVINFSHVESSGTSTADSLPCMFSRFGRKNFSTATGQRYESLLDIFRHAGFRVLWRDNNSGCKGVCEEAEVQNLAGGSDPRFCKDGECVDQILLSDWNQWIPHDSRNLLVVMHQIGSHGPAYYRRYPASFERFQPACESQDFDQCTTEQIRNAYDNSILYTDHVVASLIDQLSSESSYDTAMIYVSDHGESLGEHGLYLHGLPFVLAPDEQKHVPMILWISKGLSARFDADPARIEAIAGEGYSHDNLFHSVLGLLDIRTSEYSSALDLFARARMQGGSFSTHGD